VARCTRAVRRQCTDRRIETEIYPQFANFVNSLFA
jgi:hypothetical protein